MNIFSRYLLSCLALFCFLSTISISYAADWASVIMYHRFGEDKYPSTNISMDKFQAHLDELSSSKYSVLPLGEIVQRLEKGEELPDRTVAITIDDAYLSVYEKAWPALKEVGLPFTVFASTDHLNMGSGDFMNWQQLQEMLEGGGVYVGHHSAAHAHLPELSNEEVRDQIRIANAQFKEHLGFVPALFAYPYGEYGTEIKNIIAEFGFAAAFGQQSGVMYAGQDRFAYPRFPMSDNYGTIGRLRLAANAMPLRAKNVLPSDNILKRNPPAFGFTLAETYQNIRQLSCYASNQSGGAVPIERVGDDRIEIRLSKPYQPGRGRINCTLPGPDGRFRWFGTLFYIPRK
ncbi:polysaccharide deacetylase family protein [Sneathiella glossodoripedis]|uniref:polysaccharide deacetylase family protein n=1 Tax=Sneathiella glossodoripedis TaxID=418853 RepID=UPI000471B4C1|nr:polysaccharide deacetylase family protein [Sneathiella glossodoripedis]